MSIAAMALIFALHTNEPRITVDVSTEPIAAISGTRRRETRQPDENINDAVPEGKGVDISNFEYAGVLQDEQWTYTWYSRRVLPGLDVPGAYADELGIIRDNAGYAVVASVDLEYGTTLETAFGPTKVYDTGEFESGILDVYTDF